MGSNAFFIITRNTPFLKKDVNVESLSKIEDCLFLLCIDEANGTFATAAHAAHGAIATIAHAAQTAVAAEAATGKSFATTQHRYDLRKIDEARFGQILHGWGTKSNGSNRW